MLDTQDTNKTNAVKIIFYALLYGYTLIILINHIFYYYLPFVIGCTAAVLQPLMALLLIIVSCIYLLQIIRHKFKKANIPGHNDIPSIPQA